MFWYSESAAIRGLQTQLAAEQASHEATRRQLTIAQAEIDALAAVIARDRMRVLAETANYARQKADSEGTTDAKLAAR